MSRPVAKNEFPTKPVLCLYRMARNDTVWSMVRFLLLVEGEVSRPVADGISVIVITDRDIGTPAASSTVGLQLLPSGLSLLGNFGSFSICHSMEEAEVLLESFAGPVFCQSGMYEYVSGVVSDPQNVRSVSATNSTEIGGLHLSDLNVSSIASGYLDSWVLSQQAGGDIVTVTIENATREPDVVKIVDVLRDWAIGSGTSIVLIDLRENGRVADNDVFKFCPGVAENIEIRLALYGLSVLNIFVGSEQRKIDLPPLESSVLVVGDGDTSVLGDRAWSVPLSAPEEDVQSALKQAIAQASVAAAKGEFGRGEKQMTASIEEFYLIAVRFLQAGGEHVGKAIEILKKILQKNPNHADSWALLGMAAHLFKRYEDAVDLLKSAIALNDNDSAYYFNLGIAYLALDNRQGAIDALKAALERDPGLYEAYDVLAEIYADDRKYSLTLECLDRASELRGQWKPSSGKRAECFNALGNSDRALENMDDYMSYVLYDKANEDAAIVMIWPWCAKLYASRDAMFLTDYREIGAQEIVDRVSAG